MLFGKISLHSDSYKYIPNNLVYPITKQAGINRYSLTDEYVSKLLKNKNLNNLVDDQNIFQEDILENMDESLAKRIIINAISSIKDQEGETGVQSAVDTIFTQFNYFLDNTKKFERDILSKKFKSLCKLLLKLGSNKIVIKFPSMDIPLYRIQEETLYYEKFIKKSLSRIISLSNVALEEDVQILINYDPMNSIYNNKDVTFIGLENLSSIFQIYFPFEDFISFRVFYDRLVESNENIGLYLDVSSYFISQTQYIIQELNKSENDDLFSGSYQGMDDYLCKNPRISDQLHKPINNIEFLLGLGLNDIDWFDLFLNMYDNFHNPLDIQNFEFSNLLLKLYKRLYHRKLMGLGDLPLHSFFRSLRSLNRRNNFPDLLTFNYKLDSDVFDFDFIDWRGIDVDGLNISDILKRSINSYILEKKKGELSYDGPSKFNENIERHTKYNSLLNSQENPLSPTPENILYHKVFSLEQIRRSIKEFSGYF